MAPPHGGGAAEPVVLGAGPGVLPGDDQQPPAGPQPPGDVAQKAGLALKRHVDQRVQADDGVEGAGREIKLGGVTADERGGGDQLAGALDLDVADVHAGT